MIDSQLLQEAREALVTAGWKAAVQCYCERGMAGWTSHGDEYLQQAIAGVRVDASMLAEPDEVLLSDEQIDRIAGTMYVPIGFGGHPSQYSAWCREFARAVLAACGVASASAGQPEIEHDALCLKVIRAAWKNCTCGAEDRADGVVAVCGSSELRPPCTVCGTPYDKHGTFPTCASHPYTPDRICQHVIGAACVGAECKAGCVRASGVDAGQAPSTVDEIVRLACKWYDTGIGKGDVAHELALAVLRHKQHTAGVPVGAKPVTENGHG